MSRPVKATVASFAGLGSVPPVILDIVASFVAAKDLLRLEQTFKGIQEALHDGVTAFTFPPGKATDAAVIATVFKFHTLNSVNMKHCRNLTDAAVVAVAENCPALASLNLGCCVKLTDAAVVALAEKCPALTSLNLWGCDKLTDAAVVAVAENCPALTSLNLGGCSKVTLTLEEARGQVAEGQAAVEDT